MFVFDGIPFQKTKGYNVAINVNVDKSDMTSKFLPFTDIRIKSPNSINRMPCSFWYSKLLKFKIIGNIQYR